MGTLVLLHGGYWRPGYGLDQLDPMADVMTRAGWATWNVEYRPIGDGGAWPDPMTDVALAVDRLAREDLADRVVLLGHSAGGHLAVWAASRTERTPGGAATVRPVGAISLSGVLDLTLAATAPGSGRPGDGLRRRQARPSSPSTTRCPTRPCSSRLRARCGRCTPRTTW